MYVCVQMMHCKNLDTHVTKKKLQTVCKRAKLVRVFVLRNKNYFLYKYQVRLVNHIKSVLYSD